MEDRFLPIGTVVNLKGNNKKVMIIGFCAMNKEQNGKVFDYSGCLYPEGLLASNQTCMFDHKDIENIFFKGMQCEEEAEFKTKLCSLINNIGQSNEN